MSKYEPLWKWIEENGQDSFKLTYAQIEEILGFPIEHSFLNMSDVIACLKDKDEKAAYEFAIHIGMESAESDKYLNMIPEFVKFV